MRRLNLQVRGYRRPGMIPGIMHASLHKVQLYTAAVCTAAAQGHFDVVVGALTYVHARDAAVTVLTVSMSSRAPIQDDRQNP